MNARATGLSLFAGLALLNLATAQQVSMVTYTEYGQIGYYGEPFDCVPHVESVPAASTMKFELYGNESSLYVFAFGGLDVCRKFPGIEGGLILGTPLITVATGVFDLTGTTTLQLTLPDDFPNGLPFRFQMLGFAYDTLTPTFTRGVELTVV